MKLWQKVSLLSVCVLLAVVVCCSALLLGYARNSILSMAVEQADARQSGLITSFTEMARYYLGDESNPVVKASGVKYCFGRFADETSVLARGGETLSSSVTFDPAEYLQLTPESDSQSVMKIIFGRNVLIVGSSVAVLGDVYSVYTVKDISDVYNNITTLTWRFAAICAVCVLAGTLLIVLLVRKASQPLITLKNITRRIAVGEYGQRADIRARDEVGELAQDFNDMAAAVQSHIAQLEDTAQRQQLFIGGLTHELKTPLASMILHTDTLLTADLAADDAKDSLLHLHEQCRWLERLSQKLMKLITLEQGIQVQPENIGALLEDVRLSMAETLLERDTPLMIECEIEAMEVDYDLMKSLLVNLVDNASKASAPGEGIRLRAYGRTLEVSDRGVGISPEDISRVTDIFYMADRSRSRGGGGRGGRGTGGSDGNVSGGNGSGGRGGSVSRGNGGNDPDGRRIGGNGLGLALAKRIAEAHAAELVIDSELAVGTTVRVVFPEAGTTINSVFLETDTTDNAVFPEADTTDNGVFPEADTTTNVVFPEADTTTNGVFLYAETTDNAVFPEADTGVNVVFPEADTTTNGVFLEADTTYNAVFPEAYTMIEGVFPEADTTYNAVFPEADTTDNGVFPEADTAVNVVSPETDTTTNVVLPEADTTDNGVFPEADTTTNVVLPEADER